MITDVPQWFILFAAIVAMFLYKARHWQSTSGKLPLPPSPPGYPIIVNLFDVPTGDMEAAFRDINAKYGEIVYLNSCGQPMIVLGSHEAATDLLEKRSSNYSDRLFSVSFAAGYGIEVDKEKGIDYLGIMETFSQLFLPGKYLVETFPITRYLPYPLLGTQFKRDAADCRSVVRKMRDLPWEATMTAMREGRGLPSMASSLLERLAQLDAGDGAAAVEEDLEFSKNAVASVYAGGADTTLSTLQTFYIAMASYPEVQSRAQAELVAVVGSHRLTTFSDQNDLPYVSALIKECFRWKPVAPLALVHLSMEEDEYKGYRIPARSAVVSNPWTYARDPKLYPYPEEFKPERYLKGGKLDPSVQDPATIIFGYGRRICPGRFFAEGSVYAVVTGILYTMRVEAPLDARDKPVNLKDTVKMTHGVISYPGLFECVIKPRSSEAEMVIRAACSEDDCTSI